MSEPTIVSDRLRLRLAPMPSGKPGVELGHKPWSFAPHLATPPETRAMLEEEWTTPSDLAKVASGAESFGCIDESERASVKACAAFLLAEQQKAASSEVVTAPPPAHA